MDWVTGIVPGGKESFNAFLVIVDRCKLWANLYDILGTKLEFYTGYHPHTDGLVERMIQKMEEIIRRFCEYGMEYKDHEGDTHDWVTLLLAVELADNTSQNSTTGKSPSLVEKGWNPLLTVDPFKKNFRTIHPTAKDFHDIWKNACDTAAKFIAEAKEYNKQRYDKTHMETNFEEGEQVLVSTLSFDNLKGPKKMRDSVVGPSTIIELIGKRKWRLYSQKASLGNSQYIQNKNPTPQDIVEVKDSPGPLNKMIKARKIRLNDKDQRQYLVRFKNQTEDKDKRLAEDATPDGKLHMRRFRASRRDEKSHKRWDFLERGYVSL
ncbi:hypothetical protein O181_012328 [Austropuccinia psidii MF-1]|uniref:Integrase catalytic domain-containing protein n=1 Tax=Austropuccinia psidii MF-1 TaxID=1389203 RepID=A0A9Q3GM49_9BASI|nr:hypothetical protein [Austropuccinia psidii MF-1]